MKSKTQKIIVVALVLCFAILAGSWLARLGSEPRKLAVSIKVVGYTNDTSGNRLAMVAVTNVGRSKTKVYNPSIEIRTPSLSAGMTNYTTYPYPFPGRDNAVLAEGECHTFKLQIPTNQVPWKPEFLVYNNYGLGLFLNRLVFPSARKMPKQVGGDWVENQK